MHIISAEQALGSLNQSHVDEFFKEFNECMSDQKWIEEWRCGGDGESFWRFTMGKDHNASTEREITLNLDMAGWKVTEVSRGRDRNAYTCYYVAKA
jgi:hypothetical protein